MTSAWSANNRIMSPENSCLWLAVKVLSGSKTLGSRIVQCYAEESFGHLLSRLEHRYKNSRHGIGNGSRALIGP